MNFNNILNEKLGITKLNNAFNIKELIDQIGDYEKEIDKLKKQVGDKLWELTSDLTSAVRKECARRNSKVNKLGIETTPNTNSCKFKYNKRVITLSPNLDRWIWDVFPTNDGKSFLRKNTQILELGEDCKKIANAICDYFGKYYSAIKLEEN